MKAEKIAEALDHWKSQAGTVDEVLARCVVERRQHRGQAIGEVDALFVKGTEWCLGWFEEEDEGNWYAYSTVTARNGWRNESKADAMRWLAEQHVAFVESRVIDLRERLERTKVYMVVGEHDEVATAPYAVFSNEEAAKEFIARGHGLRVMVMYVRDHADEVLFETDGWGLQKQRDWSEDRGPWV